MANLSEKQKKKLTAFNADPQFKVIADEIEAIKTEEDFRKVMIDYLVKQELQDCDSDSTDDLIDYVTAFVEEPAPMIAETKNKKTIVEEDEEELLDQLAEEVKTEVIPTKGGVRTTTSKAVHDSTKQSKVVTKTATSATTAKKPTIVKSSVANGVEKFDARNNDDHKETFVVGFAQGLFPDPDYRIDILKQGFTVRAMLNNSQPTLFNYDNLKIDGGELIGDAYFNRFKSVEDLEAFLPKGFAEGRTIGMFRGESHPSIKAVSQQDWVMLVNHLSTEVHKRAGLNDTRMGENRAAMESKFEEVKKSVLTEKEKANKRVTDAIKGKSKK